MTQELPEGTVTVLFTDAVGSTELTNRLGDEAARSVLGACDELVREQVERHRGQEVKGTGDGIMAAFQSARRAVACAVDIQRAVSEQGRREPERAVPVRIGLNTGEVIREEADLFGATVNAAERIANQAAGGEILVAEGLKILLGSGTSVELEDRGETMLKGFAEPWKLYAVRWQREGDAASLSAGRRTPYVGRQEERARLRQLAELAAKGEGSMVMIGGEPGVGKTRLAEEIVADAEQLGLLPLTGHCYEMEGPQPYIPFVEVMEAATRSVSPEGLRNALGDEAPEVAKLMPELRRLFPDIPPPLEVPPEQERHHLFNGVREFLVRASRAQPLLLLLDDLHWGDDSTLLLLQHIAQQINEMHALILVTYRDVELDVARPLANALEDLMRQRLAQDMPLRRLPEEGVSAMLRAMSGQEPPAALAQAIYGETEGNPFFIEEVFQHLAEEGKLFDEERRWRSDLEVEELDVPRGVRLVIGRRLERVAEETRTALTAAAVIGRVFSFELLQELGEVEVDKLLDGLDEAERAQLVSSAPAGREARFTFAHELIRGTLLSSLSLPRRQRMHLQVAEAMKRLHGEQADSYAADIAHHFYQAGAAADSAETVRYLSMAASQAFAAAAFEDSLRLFDDAVGLQPADGSEAEAELRYKRGLSLRSLGRGPEAREDWGRALAIYEGLQDGEAAAKVCEELSLQLGWEAMWDEGAATVERGLRALGDEPTAARCRLIARAGMFHTLDRSFAVGDSMLADATKLAEELGDESLLGWVLGSKVSHYLWSAHPARVVDIAASAIKLQLDAGRIWEAVDSMWAFQYALMSSDRLDESIEQGEEALALAEQIGHQGGVWAAKRGLHGVAFFRSGDIDQHEAFWRADKEAGDQQGNPWVSNAYTNLSLSAFWRGRWDESLELAQQAARLEPPGFLAGFDWGGLLVKTAYMGLKEDTLALLDERKGDLPVAGEGSTLGPWVALQSAIESLAVIGETERCAELYPLAQQLVETGTNASFAYTVPPTTAGIAAASARRFDEAEQHFGAALERADNLPLVIAQPETRRWHAWMLLQRGEPGDPDKAHELLAEAIGKYREMGMPKHTEMAEQMIEARS